MVEYELIRMDLFHLRFHVTGAIVHVFHHGISVDIVDVGDFTAWLGVRCIADYSPAQWGRGVFDVFRHGELLV